MTDPMTDQTPDELASTTPPIDQPAQGVDGTASSAPEPARVAVPALCRDVWYADRQIPGSIRAAKVVGTRTSISENEGVPLPEDDLHVHLLVFPPQGAAYNATDVAYDANGAPGTWRWPITVGA